jgi:hypothetical protein
MGRGPTRLISLTTFRIAAIIHAELAQQFFHVMRIILQFLITIPFFSALGQLL